MKINKKIGKYMMYGGAFIIFAAIVGGILMLSGYNPFGASSSGVDIWGLTTDGKKITFREGIFGAIVNNVPNIAVLHVKPWVKNDVGVDVNVFLAHDVNCIDTADQTKTLIIACPNKNTRYLLANGATKRTNDNDFDCSVDIESYAVANILMGVTKQYSCIAEISGEYTYLGAVKPTNIIYPNFILTLARDAPTGQLSGGVDVISDGSPIITPTTTTIITTTTPTYPVTTTLGATTTTTIPLVKCWSAYGAVQGYSLGRSYPDSDKFCKCVSGYFGRVIGYDISGLPYQIYVDAGDNTNWNTEIRGANGIYNVYYAVKCYTNEAHTTSAVFSTNQDYYR